MSVPMNSGKLKAVRAREETRDAALASLITAMPYSQFLGVDFTRSGDELTARLPFAERLIGNPAMPAIHGGVIGSFLEITAILQLCWDQAWSQIDSGAEGVAAAQRGDFASQPKTIDISIDFLRSGQPRDVFARAIVTRRGRRIANVRIEAWQDERRRPIATGHAHFLLAATPKLKDAAS